MKNFKLMALVILGMLVLSASDCHRKDFKNLFIKNASNKSIYYLPSFSYPDTTISINNPAPVPGQKIKPKETKEFGPGGDAFEMNSTLIFFIFDADTVEQVPWDTIVKKYIILKRYEVTQQDMENMNWTITYP